MTLRNKTRLFTFSAAVFFALLAVTAISLAQAKSYREQLEISYQYSLNELAESLESIQTNLSKTVYSGSDEMLADLSSDLYSECTQAKSSLSRLPVDQMNLGSTFKFISQAADYALYISEKAAGGKEITEDEYKSLLTLLDYSDKLSESVASMVDTCNSGGKILGSNVRNSANVSVSHLSNTMSGAEEVFKDYPTLLYDGPFADAVLNKEVQMTKDKDAYSKEQARDIAADAISKSADELSFDGYDESRLECYVFKCAQQTIGVTKYGGYVAYVLYGGRVADSSISEENAVNIGKAYLDALGYENMAETYYMTYKNVCVINFAYTVGGVTYYSDLIKVGVSLSDGNVVSMEAKGFLTNHTQRKPFEGEISSIDAATALNPHLTLIGIKRCVIPNDNGTESECYELHCKSRDTNEEVLVYTDAHTGEEKDIQILLYSDGGTLTK